MNTRHGTALRLALLFCFLLTGCGAGALAPKSDDPVAMLDRADRLVHDEDRPIPAERLILDAADISKQRDDQRRLGNAYRQYAEFLQSTAVERSGRHYGTTGFINPSVTFANRQSKAIEYYEMALSAYAAAEKKSMGSKAYDDLSSIYLNMGNVYYRLGNGANACLYYDKSLKAHQEDRVLHPGQRYVLPPGYKSFEDVIAPLRRAAKC